MEDLIDNYVIIKDNEISDKIEYTEFSLLKNYSKNNVALKIDFKNNIPYSIQCIKRLIHLKGKNKSFSSQYQDKKVKYIICNYNPQIIDALKAIEISDKKEKYTFLFESICNTLDDIWKKDNPCNFCNGVCAASVDYPRFREKNGCCAEAFRLSDLKKITLKRTKTFSCKHLGENGCTTQNTACKLFICQYLRKNKLIKINTKELILMQSFFSRKQRLILTYNFFKTKEELIDKLLEKNSTLPFWYSYKMMYLIDD